MTCHQQDLVMKGWVPPNTFHAFDQLLVHLLATLARETSPVMVRLAGFPLTDKLLSTSFTVLSGHDANAVDWEALRGNDTLVILMGGASLPGAPMAVGCLKTVPCKIVHARRSSGCLHDQLGHCRHRTTLVMPPN